MVPAPWARHAAAEPVRNGILGTDTQQDLARAMVEPPQKIAAGDQNAARGSQ